MEVLVVNTHGLAKSGSLDPHFWNGRRVLVTGHTGFKGSWLVLWLLEMGAKVTGMALEPESVAAPGESLFNLLGLSDRLGPHHRIGDIRSPELVCDAVASAEPEVVFHLAAQALVRRSYADPLGTWSTNVQGSLLLLEALRGLRHPCAVVMVTTDKVYANQDWMHGYRESDRLGGHDPYSASKAAAELAIESWRASFAGTQSNQSPWLGIATARAGNVIGGGDWATHRLMPDAIRSLWADQPISVRNPNSTRPWQHVLEPLSGYLVLAELLLGAQGQSGLSFGSQLNPYAAAFNFGPVMDGHRSVGDVVRAVIDNWPGVWHAVPSSDAPHEAVQLRLQIEKARHELGWQPRWDFFTSVNRTVGWYRNVRNGANPWDSCCADLQHYVSHLEGLK